MSKPLSVLVTNDDGVESAFLRALVRAHQEAGFSVFVAAPQAEQSWISRALSRRREVAVRPAGGWDCPAWVVDGTPTDCVNIALGHLLPEKPDAVISGINLGFNANLPYVTGSGTVAGAFEGALWRIPASAYSLQLPVEQFERIRATFGNELEGLAADSLRHASARAALLTREVIAYEKNLPSGVRVHNYNFPRQTLPDTILEKTQMGDLVPAPLFEEVSKGTFRFKFPFAPPFDDREDTDQQCLNRGHISHCVLDYEALGRWQ